MRLTAPNSKEATEKVNELWKSARRYYDESDLLLRQAARLGQQLLKSDPAAGWTILASVSALSGNVKSALANSDKASRLSNQPAVTLTRAGMLSNLGYFSEAGRVFRQVMSVNVLPWPKIGSKAIATGSILALDEALQKAGNMPTAVADSLQKSTATAAVILRRNNISDEDVGGWLDAAGETMREQRFFFIDDVLLFATTEEDFGQVDVSLVVDVDPAEAARLNLDLVERCVRSAIIPPECFSFGFRSALELNERIAA